jgi:tRNA(Ile2) C34 agmatinyltransferase TiaS
MEVKYCPQCGNPVEKKGAWGYYCPKCGEVMYLVSSYKSPKPARKEEEVERE